jgi:hypothetical protein
MMAASDPIALPRLARVEAIHVRVPAVVTLDESEVDRYTLERFEAGIART